MITHIEELSLNAWASLHTFLYDGWVICFSDGYTKRANSVNPLYPSTVDIDEKISFCENLYENKNMAVIFKITSAAYPRYLDERLNKIGYRKDSPVSVKTADLESAELFPASEVNLNENLSDEWLENFCRMNSVEGQNRRTLKKILLNILPEHRFVSVKSDGNIIACGLGVLQSGYIGLFDIVTDKDFRNRGYGGKIVSNLLAWGKQNNAKKAYLQVTLDNMTAINLYSKIGFVEEYQYWYRIKA